MKKISFIITAFNEEGNIKELYRQIEEVTSIYENYIFEYIFWIMCLETLLNQSLF